MITIELTALDVALAENALRIARNIADTLHRQTGDDLVLHQHHGRTRQAEHSAALRDLAAAAVTDYARAAHLVSGQTAAHAAAPGEGRRDRPVQLTLAEPMFTVLRRAVQVAVDHVRRSQRRAADEGILHQHHNLPGAAAGPDVMTVLHQQTVGDYERVLALLDAHHPTSGDEPPATGAGDLAIVGIVTAIIRADDLSTATAVDASRNLADHLPPPGTPLADGLTLTTVAWDHTDAHLITVPIT